MRISDWSSDVCSSDLRYRRPRVKVNPHPEGREAPVGRSARAAVAGVPHQPPSAMVLAVGGATQGLQQRQHLGANLGVGDPVVGTDELQRLALVGEVRVGGMDAGGRLAPSLLARRGFTLGFDAFEV